MRENGRSMVEMLGVLAIVGVLSIGAISGYSKAMMKYKLNKQAEAMNMLLNNAMQLSLPISNNGDVLYSELLNKLNLLPDGISADPFNPNMLRDVFGNGIWFFTQSNASYGLGYGFSKDNRNRLAICSNLLNIYKAYHTELYRILSDTYTVNDDDDVSVDYFGIFYGDKYCTNNVKCIRNISLNDIETLCQSCSQDADDCRLYVTWK